MGVALSEVPRTWREMLSDYWGATSLHGAVYRRPHGVRWVHCARCRLPSPPSSQWQFCPFVPSAAKIAERVDAWATGTVLPAASPLTMKRMAEIIAREFARARANA